VAGIITHAMMAAPMNQDDERRSGTPKGWPSEIPSRDQV
jgi:hypothetical protein